MHPSAARKLLRAKNKRTTPVTKKSSIVTYSTVTATLALLITVGSFYFTWIYESHSVRLAVVNTMPGIDPERTERELPIDLAVDFALSNLGNKTETVVFVQPVVLLEDGKTYWDGQKKGPYILKAGEALADRAVISVTPADFRRVASGKPAVSAEFRLVTATLLPSGPPTFRNFPVGTVSMREHSNQLLLHLDGLAWGEGIIDLVR